MVEDSRSAQDKTMVKGPSFVDFPVQGSFSFEAHIRLFEGSASLGCVLCQASPNY